MSEVLEDFIDPYLSVVKNKREQTKLLDLAVMAWNIALLPKKNQRQVLDEIIE